MTNAIVLTKAERMELERRAASRTGRAEDARRARVILLLGEGHTWDETCERLESAVALSTSGIAVSANWTYPDYADLRIDGATPEQRIAGLHSRNLGQVASTLTPQVEARILEATRRAPADGATHWSTRKLGVYLNISHMMVARGVA